MPSFTDIWEITPETAHERARQLVPVDSFVWDFGDEDSPLGNDIGADTFAAYLDFRKEQPKGKVQDFIANLFDVFELEDADWDLLDPEALQEALDEDEGFSVVTRDEFILGLAFAQLLVEGELDEVVKTRAMLALKRQSSDVLMEFHEEEDTAPMRREQLDELAVILGRA
ncbi:hypothetical protein [Luteolibacter sp. LG18]|uniref:hypothetical protein n=1 Tax=Luteolibacter sp. LG18 TaxID=2819286 RepID=UPI002B292A99|nr:hypothetical protein llg_20400 [Luteolibacter sp. LG18]